MGKYLAGQNRRMTNDTMFSCIQHAWEYNTHLVCERQNEEKRSFLAISN